MEKSIMSRENQFLLGGQETVSFLLPHHFFSFVCSSFVSFGPPLASREGLRQIPNSQLGLL
jgi:hypothetical protein